jgi:hypothetical protein
MDCAAAVAREVDQEDPPGRKARDEGAWDGRGERWEQEIAGHLGRGWSGAGTFSIRLRRKALLTCHAMRVSTMMATAAAALGTVRCDSHSIEPPFCVLAELRLSNSDESRRSKQGQTLRGSCLGSLALVVPLTQPSQEVGPMGAATAAEMPGSVALHRGTLQLGNCG